MFFNKLKGLTIDKFVVKDLERKDAGYVYWLQLNVMSGFTILVVKNYRIVFPYRLLASLALFLIATMILKFTLHPKEVNWFKSFLDLGILGGLIVFSVMYILKGKTVEELSLAVDAWWTYKYLEEETLEMKSDIQQRLEGITGAFIDFLKYTACAYVSLPFIKYISSGGQNKGDLLVVDSLHEEPWIYIEMVCGILAMYIATCNVGYLVVNMFAVSFTHNAQIQLAGIGFSTIQQRVRRMLDGWDQETIERDKMFEKLVQKEIKSCAMHYQAIYRQTKQLYGYTKLVVNYTNYVGCACFVAMGVLVAKERDNTFLLIQVGGMIAAEMCGLFLFSYPIDSLKDEVEDFKTEVYGSQWWDMPLPCQRSVHIMQTMLMYPPRFTTLLGADMSIEFFGKLLNAGYYFITAILSMDIQ